MRYGDDRVLLGGWESKLVADVRAITSGVPGGGSTFTTAVLDRIHRAYVALLDRGYGLPRYDTAAGDANARRMLLQLSADTGYNTAVIRAFLVSLYNGMKSGEVPEQKYDPVGYAQRVKRLETLDPSSKSVIRRAADTASAAAGVAGKLGIGLVALAALGAAVYFRLGRK